MDIDNVLERAMPAVIAAMREVRLAQGKPVHDIETKPDETIVTATDRKAAEVAEPLLVFDGIPLNVEDGTRTEQGEHQFSQDLDTLDGTSVFAGGLMTSTIIWGLYHNRKVVAAIVGEPVSNRIWFATEKISTKLRWNDKTIPTTVTGERLSKKTTVFIDISHGFTRSGRQILTDETNSAMYTRLNRVTKIIMPGSNGLMHALVANGGLGIVGSITTALGGPWDAIGVLLVLRAGGSAKAFRVLSTGDLEEKDPLCPDKYDILVCGNSPQTVGTLSQTLTQ